MRQSVPNLPSTTALLKAKGDSRILVPVPERAADKPPQQFDQDTWTRLIGLLADGVKVHEAMEAAGMLRHTLEGILRTDTKKKEQYDDAKLASLRRHWDYTTLEDIFCDIAMGKAVKDAVDERGLNTNSFYKLVLNDPITKEMYDNALKIQAETMADEIIEIADFKENDQWFDDTKKMWKTNNEVVNRSRLKVDARKWKMAKLHSKRFGDKVQQDITANIVVDHAARLEEARKRVETIHREKQ